MINPSDFYKWLLVFGVGTDQPPGTFATQLQVQSWAFNKASDTGIANAYAIALNPVLSAYFDGLVVLFDPAHSNTTSNPTLAINGLTAHTITLTSGAALNPNDLVAGTPALLIYNAASTSFMLLNPVNANGGFAWNGVSGTTQTAAINNGYIIQNAAQTTITLPTTFAIGDTIKIKGLGAGGWILAAGASTVIHMGSSVTSSAGSLTSTNQYDTVTLSGLIANSAWSVDSCITAGFTIA